MKFLRSCLTVAEIRNKILFTVFFVALFRMLSYLPAPMIDASVILTVQHQLQGSFGAMNFLASSGQGQFSLAALGIMPIIIASVVVQMLTAVVPSLHKLQNSGPAGQAKITQYTRYATIAIAIFEAAGYVHKLKNLQVDGIYAVPDQGLFALLVLGTALVTGTVLIMLLSELITSRGLANGMSILVFAAVASKLIPAVQTWLDQTSPTWHIVGVFAVLALTTAVVYVQKGYKKLAVSYGRESISQRDQAAQMTFLPIPLNSIGVIPVIFAASLLGPLNTLLASADDPMLKTIHQALMPGHWLFLLLQTAFIVFFAYFYTALTINPVERADDLRFSGGYVVGTEPGRPTVYLLDKIMSRLILPGAVFLAAIVAVPSLLLPVSVQQLGFSGVTVVIVVGVALEAASQLKTLVMIENYDRNINVEI